MSNSRGSKESNASSIVSLSESIAAKVSQLVKVDDDQPLEQKKPEGKLCQST